MTENIKFKNTHTMWTSHTERVDLETGEPITKWNAEHNYIHVKTDKHVTFNYNKTKGTIHYTKGYQRDLKLF